MVCWVGGLSLWSSRRRWLLCECWLATSCVPLLALWGIIGGILGSDLLLALSLISSTGTPSWFFYWQCQLGHCEQCLSPGTLSWFVYWHTQLVLLPALLITVSLLALSAVLSTATLSWLCYCHSQLGPCHQLCSSTGSSPVFCYWHASLSFEWNSQQCFSTGTLSCVLSAVSSH